MDLASPQSNPTFLGIETGATRTVALWTGPAMEAIGREELGPANCRLMTDRQIAQLFTQIRAMIPTPDAIGVGMAGIRGDSDRERVAKIVAKTWPETPFRVAHDLESGLASAEAQTGANSTRVLIVSGTGSCCYGKNSSGKTAKVGGWGHLLGDKGSGYEIGLRALKAVVFYFDRDGRWPSLGQRILHRLQLNEPDDLVEWVQKAPKDQVAALAIEVFSAARRRNKIARDILEAAASTLSKDAVACAKRLAEPGSKVHFVFNGGNLLRQTQFAKQVAENIRTRWPNASVSPLSQESAIGAAVLAKRAYMESGTRIQRHQQPPRKPRNTNRSQAHRIPESIHLSPTEQRNPASLALDEISLAEAIELMIAEDRKIPEAIRKIRTEIEKVTRWTASCFRRGGRLFYVGAGTSGRLGVLDASECPPTFQSPPEQVQGIIAGGAPALWKSIEGAEDDPAAGERAIAFRKVNRNDIVIGIAASGRTPFVWGALGEAKGRGAKTVLLSFNPHLRITKAIKPSLLMTPEVGPEVLTGSTRLKAGTATKLILNMITTLAMVRCGKVLSNLMVDVAPTNTKLRDRAVRIVQTITGAGSDQALSALNKSRWDIKAACRGLRSKAPINQDSSPNASTTK